MGQSEPYERHWYCTSGAEWIIWSHRATGKVYAFQIVIKDSRQFFEWHTERGVGAGAHDDGDSPGRYKMSPVLISGSGLIPVVAEAVLTKVNQQRSSQVVPLAPAMPRRSWASFFWRTPEPEPLSLAVSIPEDFLQFIESVAQTHRMDEPVNG